MLGQDETKPQDKPKRVYFEPGVVLLAVEHDEPLKPEAVIDQLRVAVRQETLPALSALVPQRSGEAQFDAKRTLSFTHLNADYRRELKLPPHRAPGAKYFTLVRSYGPQDWTAAALLEGMIRLNRVIARQAWRAEIGQGLVLRAAAPNWLNTPAPNVSGGGGPGTVPVPYDPGATGGTAGQTMPRFELAAPLAGNPEQPAPVDVIILDTIPPDALFEQAITQWPSHPLLQSISAPGVLTRAYCADANDPTWQLPPTGGNGVQVAGHSYAMGDHGLFVAGIVHEIAPNAKLRLIEVLNQDGVGYMDSIAAVLAQLGAVRQNQPDGPPLIINCSFTIVAPLAGQFTPDPATEDELETVTEITAAPGLIGQPPGSLTADEQSLLDQLDALAVALEWVLLGAGNWNALVVAAAGNDGPPTSGLLSQHPARCPAAFATVVGVGALDDQGDSAGYSNKADRQTLQGLATFGGMEDPADATMARPRRAWAGHAPLSLYLGNFFDATGQAVASNQNGWAWWAGTSFAAPIISGFVAQQLAANPALTLAAALQALIDLPDGTTAGGGDERVSVTQVF